ncbi:flagellar motor switch protein FliG [Acetobacterium wieringae]|uniref:Flagellar motor switch protein FliG n=1 Tax=Acetobacterium wieringae TaxID=52694 RepID=A0A5D0WPF3_9FIRM|nr:flagellar motor switch protein FliG [Acetobacterium wieringae]MEA4805920.1 flagellar motor switch protein FliG [Acetobacterium wieringae]TYC85983.1 flagellar motor switch protein FliG [Acetobacterium wieringae]URN85430.1 flagellar motor switch protein FliG [Acetobacterium wieringae]UYO63850.1 flagellar motor switch protein FliG [Acetobacterium wieringae]VUZ27248.1 Flagellar motor switch protein FliG [Acetobacterium wieringae]
MDVTLTPRQKAAQVVISLGADIASSIYKHLQEDEIEILTYEITRQESVPPEVADQVIDEFYGLCVAQKVYIEGGINYARNVLEKAFGVQQGSALLERVTKTLRTKAFEFIRKADYKNLMNMIMNEHPQTIALVLSYARADQASAIISELPKSIRVEVVERIARMDRTSPEIIRQVETILERKFESVVSFDLLEVGGINYIAEIMNNIDRGTEKYIFDELSKNDAKLSEEIRKRMFVFEDIVILDSMSIQRFLQEVDTKEMSVALKGANKGVADVIFANMSQRMGETVKSEMEFLHNVRVRDVEEAQQKIVSVIRRLEEEGEIVTSKGGKDEIIV